jgi:hypothetical protein
VSEDSGKVAHGVGHMLVGGPGEALHGVPRGALPPLSSVKSHSCACCTPEKDVSERYLCYLGVL